MRQPLANRCPDGQLEGRRVRAGQLTAEQVPSPTATQARETIRVVLATPRFKLPFSQPYYHAQPPLPSLSRLQPVGLIESGWPVHQSQSTATMPFLYQLQQNQGIAPGPAAQSHLHLLEKGQGCQGSRGGGQHCRHQRPRCLRRKNTKTDTGHSAQEGRMLKKTHSWTRGSRAPPTGTGSVLHRGGHWADKGGTHSAAALWKSRASVYVAKN